MTHPCSSWDPFQENRDVGCPVVKIRSYLIGQLQPYLRSFRKCESLMKKCEETKRVYVYQKHTKLIIWIGGLSSTSVCIQCRLQYCSSEVLMWMWVREMVGPVQVRNVAVDCHIWSEPRTRPRACNMRPTALCLPCSTIIAPSSDSYTPLTITSISEGGSCRRVSDVPEVQ